MRFTNSVRAALVTASLTFLTTFGTSAVGWLSAVQEAATNGGPIPSTSILASAAIAAFVSALTGFINWAIRAGQERLNAGRPPVYPSQTYWR